MKTDDLISVLANQVTPVKRASTVCRCVIALSLGVLGSLIIMTVVFGIRHDLVAAAHTGLFWAKLAYPLAIAIGAMLAISRLGRPGARAGVAWALIALPFVAVWIAGALSLDDATPATCLSMLRGQSWRSCPFNILLLSVPTFPAVFWWVKALAPTQLRLTGAVAGLLASSAATIVYCVHCPEMNPVFWSMWYALGMATPACLGAWLGPQLLRW